jgi:hypothetical protein
MSITNHVYTKAGTYDDGTEVTPPGRACPQGRTVAKRLRVTEAMASKIRQGEVEHCEDKRLAYALSIGKFNQAIKDLEGEYCPGAPPGPNPPECQKEFEKRFEDRTGVAFAKNEQVINCLLNKSKLRDDPPHRWHDVQADDWFYAPGCGTVTYILSPHLSPHIGTHPSSEIVKGCGEK